ncbi:hypothetical protein SAMN02745823_01088 [Sporobacter termitidis DSM 10068]|uniref:Uncharacterized protein n=1 Tax=Sporobacter termitidis DSM 10068 TaxID=1123282 RepID=A0A1M5W5X9_9FIRM|nr:hypothetical protein [Sporobacter termitidis]SHH82999.1 hypothetical protein SAMN02745823_01088 [Sporobacter termitidis DSM 10068]
MALEDYHLFTWKSKAQQEQEQVDYEKWAFPYGQKQRDNLVKLMLEVFPKENEATTLIPFLTCKELFGKLCKTPDMFDYAIGKMLTDVKKYKRVIRKKEMPLYVALVVADARIGEDCEYPSAQQVKDMAAGFAVTKT